MVVLPELFLLFLPPLWPFLVLVVFLPLVGAALSVLPPVACPKDRVAPSNIVITTVNSLFMQSPLWKVFWNLQFVQTRTLCKSFLDEQKTKLQRSHHGVSLYH